MHDRTIEQIRHGREPDMRMRAHIEALPEQEFAGAHLVEEDERPDHLLAHGGQGAAHLEPADIAGARHDHLLDGLAGAGIAGSGVVMRQG